MRFSRKIMWRLVTGFGVFCLMAAIGVVAGFIFYSAGSTAAVKTMAETGSSLEAPLFGEWGGGSGYQQSHPNVLLVPGSTDSGTGIKDAESGLVAIGAADLPAPAAKGILSIPDAVGGVAVVYNVPGLRSVNLNGQVLAGMYAGRITNWDSPAIAALNPGVKLPDVTIRPVERSDSSGTTYVFTSYLQEQSSEGWPAPAKTQAWLTGTGVAGNNAMVSTCGKVKGCVAYVGVSYENVATTQYKLGLAALADGAGKYLLPTRANIGIALAESGGTHLIGTLRGYPAVNYEYAIVKVQQPSGQAASSIRQFLQWAVTTGSSDKYLAGLNFEPLPANVLATAEAQIASIR